MKGLTSAEVESRVEAGKVNYNTDPQTKSEKKIITSNLFTYFNILNFFLAFSIIVSSIVWGNFFEGIKNVLFLGVVIINSVISILHEIVSKRTIDKLSLLTRNEVTAIRDSQPLIIGIEEIVIDEVLYLKTGDQIPSDAVLLDGEIEVSEEFITGESKRIKKGKDDNLLSGSYLVSGECHARVIHVGSDNYISVISSEAKYQKKVNSMIKDSFDKIVKIISVFIIPIGFIMLVTQLRIPDQTTTEAIYATVAALIGMIPEGLILLTSSVMAVSVYRLSKHSVLVQELYAIETLARVDVLCFDKTGTLTENKMEVINAIPKTKKQKKQLEALIADYISAFPEENASMIALKEKYPENQSPTIIEKMAFSSERKFSGVQMDSGTYYLGAASMLGIDLTAYESELKEVLTKRILTLAKSNTKLTETPKKLEVIGFIILDNKIKEDAKETIAFFKEQKLIIKIISGDQLETILDVTKKVGLEDAKGIDVSGLSEEELIRIVDDYDVYARVSPFQKRTIIKTLQASKHTVGMTGDGVNDVLALKTSDFAISFKEATAPARNVSQIILLDNNFSSLPKVVAEGRRSINNLERSASLLLVKTIYTMLLVLFSILISERYFFVPIQLTLITGFTIGIPSFILALEKNEDQVKGNFLLKIMSKSLPTALTVVINIVLIIAFKYTFDLSDELISTLAVFLTGTTGFIFLWRVCQPFNILRALLFSFLFLGFGYCILFQYDFFNITEINNMTILIFFVLYICSVYLYDKLNKLSIWFFNKFDKSII